MGHSPIVLNKKHRQQAAAVIFVSDTAPSLVTNNLQPPRILQTAQKEAYCGIEGSHSKLVTNRLQGNSRPVSPAWSVREMCYDLSLPQDHFCISIVSHYSNPHEIITTPFST